MALHVIVGMSGGVDSSVAAYLLQQEGHNVECIFMKNWEETDENSRCTTEKDYKDALEVCQRLGLALHSVNFVKDYKKHVFQYFLDEYGAGRTPNPDVLCNKEIKFKVFLKYAMKLGADKIATGHYADVKMKDDLYQLRKGSDPAKDQSYFLYLLGQKELSKTLFPLAAYDKQAVRELARSLNLATHEKKDSTGICFIGERNFRNFLQQYFPNKPGDIITIDGKKIGQHTGLMYYTRGQRQGIGVGGGFSDKEGPWYVQEKNIKKNELIIVQGHNHPKLYNKHITLGQLHWIGQEPRSLPLLLTAKIRYRQMDQVCSINNIQNGKAQISFEEQQYAPALGQSVVFYDQSVCLGGGIIESYE
ncbi:tRNA 2-thiouridine(34) synthase MnmA [Candidatus Neomarinimicrobiota bacterium]